VRSWSIATTI
jgi:hypothetical protein